jgi:hypothetical protein
MNGRSVDIVEAQVVKMAIQLIMEKIVHTVIAAIATEREGKMIES